MSQRIDDAGKGSDRTRKPVSKEASERAQKHALASLAPTDRLTMNLYMDHRELEKGTRLGPRFAPVVLEQPTVLVFVDEHPRASFGHDCRYGLYDTQGNWLRDIKAQFPPFPLLPAGPLRAFHEPVPESPQLISLPQPPAPPCPVLPPFGRRYAVLFAGDCEWRHANGLELCYRTLVGPFGFDADDVFVYCFDGKKDSGDLFTGQDGKLRKFPVGDPKYHMRIRGAGTAKNLQKRFEKLSAVIKPQDMLFIYTDGHGGNDEDPDGVFLATFADPDDAQDSGAYHIGDLARDLKLFENKPYAALITLLAQCHAGGFKTTVLEGANATRTAACWAAQRGQWAYRSEDYPIMQFALEWLVAQRSQELNGDPVDADGDGDGAVEASEAYGYAEEYTNDDDTPGSAFQNGGQTIALSASNPVDSQWCSLVSPVLALYWEGTPETEFYEKLQRALPQLREMVLPLIEQNARVLKTQLTPTIRRIFAAAFEPKTRRGPRHARKASSRKSSSAGKARGVNIRVATRKASAGGKPSTPRKAPRAGDRRRGQSVQVRRR